MAFEIKRASRSRVKLRIAFQSVSGGGKTAGSLLMAKGMIQELRRRGELPDHLDCHIGVIDTERDSASLYSHLTEFDTIVLEPPYSPQRYMDAQRQLEAAGYSVIIIDQISHEWTGPGGVLDMVSKEKGLNDFAKWNGPSQMHDEFIDGILHSPAHVIVTMRSKTEYVLEEQVGRDGKTRKVPVRKGMQARQREGTEFEFTCLFDLAHGSNAATCYKDRTELFTVGAVVPRDADLARANPSDGMGSAWGRRLIEWVYTAATPGPEQGRVAVEDQCIALADAGIRACERAANLPDLVVAFDAGQKSIRALAPQVGRDIATRELDRLKAVKDKLKVALGTAGGNAPVQVDGEPISPDDAANLEVFIEMGKVDAALMKHAFNIPRLAALPLSRFEEAVTWIAREASAQGIILTPIKHRAPPADPPTVKDVLHETVTRIGNERGGLFAGDQPSDGGLSTMPDDLPWSDEVKA